MPRRAFTLVELLVVVTIIVLLLSLLMPAMSKAVYQAQLVQCGGKLKVTATAVTTYAFGNRRYYPDRGLADISPYSSDQPPSTVQWISAMALANPADGYDMRPLLRTVMDINQVLQCPFTLQMDLENGPEATDDDVGAEASYVMFWGWRYRTGDRVSVNANQGSVNQRAGNDGEHGMYKVGDRFTWTNQNGQSTAFNILAGDIDLKYPDSSQASHPDRDPSLLTLVAAQDTVIFGFRGSLSRYRRAAPETGDKLRGLLDTNFLFDDGSVRRYQDVPHMIRGWGQRDKRFEWTPIQFDMRRSLGEDALQLPVK